MNIVIQPESARWFVRVEGKPQMQFESKASVWAYVMNLESSELITVIAYDTEGQKVAEVTLLSELSRRLKS